MDTNKHIVPNCNVDCAAGRKMGCLSFCCRMLVRLKPHEMEPGVDGMAAKGFVDKTPDGYCIHLDQKLGLCGIWENRPEACQEYTCEGDPNLQIVLRDGILNIVEIAKRAAVEYIHTETYIKIPTLK